MKVFWSILLITICSSCAKQDRYIIIKTNPVIEKTGPTKDGSIVPDVWLQHFYLDSYAKRY